MSKYKYKLWTSIEHGEVYWSPHQDCYTDEEWTALTDDEREEVLYSAVKGFLNWNLSSGWKLIGEKDEHPSCG